MELGQVMRTFGWTPLESELQELIGVIDQDDNGCISFDEFVWLMSQDLHDEDIEDEIRDAFRVFDREVVPQIDPSVPQPVVQSRRRPLLGECSSRFQPGEGPSRGLLRDCTTGCGTDGSICGTNGDCNGDK